MRSTAVTLVLALLATACGVIAVVRMRDGGLARIFGNPPVQAGEPLFEFDPAEARRIRLVGNGVSAVCERGEQGWQVVEPWQDRMDPRVAQAILEFTLGTRVAAAFPSDKIESNQLGFADGRVDIGITTADRRPLAQYNLGRRTAWFSRESESGDLVPTVFVYPATENREDHIYATTGDIHPLFDGGFRHLRDHHPFLFRPEILDSIRIRTASGELQLARAEPRDPWKIVKPIELRTDREAVIRLIQGLYDLRAVEVADREQVTLPAADTTTPDQIAIRFFGAEEETVLDFFRPEAGDATEVLARISDRPNAVFRLPRKSNPDLVSLSDLPLTVNELRDPTLTALNIAALQGIRISPATGEEILIARDQGGPWRVGLGGRMQPLNETSLFSLLKTVTESRVAGFVTDAATDLKPHGLDRPFLILRFLSFADSPAGSAAFELLFGQAQDGSIHAMRAGTTSVFRIDPAMLAMIPTRTWEWRDPSLWRLSPTNVAGLNRRMEGQAPLVLDYNFARESWNARLDGDDRSDALSPERANRLLEEAVALDVDAWLPPDHADAAIALERPTMIFTVVEKLYDDEGEFAGLKPHELRLAPVSDSPANRRYYGRTSDEPNPFLLHADTYDRLAVELFEFTAPTAPDPE